MMIYGILLLLMCSFFGLLVCILELVVIIILVSLGMVEVMVIVEYMIEFIDIELCEGFEVVLSVWCWVIEVLGVVFFESFDELL